MIRTIRVARTAFLLSFTLIGLTIVGGLIYLNQVGFPGRYGDWLKSELANKGVHLSFKTLRFDFKQGLVATDVSFYSDEGQLAPLLEGSKMALDLDKTKALRGKFKLRSLMIIDGIAHIPIDHDGRNVIARDIHGKVKITESPITNIRGIKNITCLISSYKFTLNKISKRIIDKNETIMGATIN